MIGWTYHIISVGETIINHPFGNYQRMMVKLGWFIVLPTFNCLTLHSYEIMSWKHSKDLEWQFFQYYVLWKILCCFYFCGSIHDVSTDEASGVSHQSGGPGGQLMHFVEPISAAKVPLAQGRQKAAPLRSEKCPDGHTFQGKMVRKWSENAGKWWDDGSDHWKNGEDDDA